MIRIMGQVILRLVQSSVMSSRIQVLFVFFFLFCYSLHVNCLSSHLLPHGLEMAARTQIPCPYSTVFKARICIKERQRFSFCEILFFTRKKNSFRSPAADLSLCLIGYIWLKSKSLVKENGVNIHA